MEKQQKISGEPVCKCDNGNISDKPVDKQSDMASKDKMYQTIVDNHLDPMDEYDESGNVVY